MIPLHLRTTTVHVSREQAERLVERGVAQWLDAAPALLVKAADDAEVLAQL